MTDQELWDQVAFYTLEHARTDLSFIHQYVVDAYAAQHPAETTKNIRTAFALIGLYLHVEKGYTGKQVQLAHMQMAKTRNQWPSFIPPTKLGDITVADVLNTRLGTERDAMIEKWCASVWEAWHPRHQEVKDLVQIELWAD
jgi:hypothetical protein